MTADIVVKDQPLLTRSDVREMMHEEFKEFLDDIEFRVAQAMDHERAAFELHAAKGADEATWVEDGKIHYRRKVYAEDLHTTRPMITGYTLTANTPTAGNIQWSQVHIVFNGTDYPVDGAGTGSPTSNTTSSAIKYVWFDAAVSSTVLQQSTTKPSLSGNATMVFYNDGGTPRSVLDGAGGTAWVMGDNTVGAGEVINGSLTSSQLSTTAGIIGTQLANSTITSTQLSASAILAVNFSAGSVDSTALANNAVMNVHISATAGITGTKLLASTITSTQLSTSAVVAANLSNGAVTSNALGASAVTFGKISTNAVTSNELSNNAVLTTHISANQVTLAKMSSGAVDSTVLANNAVMNVHISATAGITGTKLLASTITSTQLSTSAVVAANLSNGAVTSNALGTSAVTSTAISANAVINGKIAANAITSVEISANAVSNAALINGAVTAVKFATTRHQIY